MTTVPEKIPASGPRRRQLQERGQFWTPDWVAGPMVSYVLGAKPEVILDPAAGEGVFFHAAREQGYTGRFRGHEVDEKALAQSGLDSSDITLGDFLEIKPQHSFRAIVSNPPYIRHHRIPQDLKARLRGEVRAQGLNLDARAGIHVYFFLRCLESLAPGGRLAFIVSADICEGIFARRLWLWVIEHFRLHAVATFAPDAVPFPGVDTNALIIALEKTKPETSFIWGRVSERSSEALAAILAGRSNAFQRRVAEAVETGLSRPPVDQHGAEEEIRLGDVAQVMRGVATGANYFFFLTSEQIARYALPIGLFRRAIGRTRDCRGHSVELVDLEMLDRAGRPTWLLDLPVSPVGKFPRAIQKYLRLGEEEGLPKRPLIRSRKCWYQMEQREPPAILFAYLGRRSCRFIRNLANIVPLTGFLCVYPRKGYSADELWRKLNDPRVLERLPSVGKSYGAGAIKVEPRALESLRLPLDLFPPLSCTEAPPRQLRLLEESSSYQVTRRGG
ncbi:MAG: Eco57I restriction-modification methylase domain-containing protein [Burkholderiales bacterium]